MKITITKVSAKLSESQLGNNIYLIEFETPYVSGQAMLYSPATSSALLSASHIYVETGYNDIEDFRFLSESSQSFTGKLLPLSNPCDYEVTGQVEYLNEDIFDVYVENGECSFSIAFDESVPTNLKKGNWVTFKVNLLELYDENI
jgi:hypothetical protein